MFGGALLKIILKLADFIMAIPILVFGSHIISRILFVNL